MRRGPYTAAATLVCATCRDFGAGDAVLAPHRLSLLSVAPELADWIDVPADLRASFAFSREGNLHNWTLRIAHGVTDFLLAAWGARGGATVTFLETEQADPTDREWIDVLCRRADPAVVTVHFDRGSPESFAGDAVGAARAFLAAGSPLWRGAADDGAGAPVGALLRASDLAMRMAYYDAALEWAELGRGYIDPAAQAEDFGKLTRNALFALLLLGRYPEAEAICRAMQEREPDPALLAHVTYVMAILNARLYDPARHDYDAARAWIERSMGFTDRLPPSETRAVNHAFLMNTLALVEMRKGRPAQAFALLNAGLEHMKQHAPQKYPLECGILLHNRARLHVAVKQRDGALADLTLLLAFEPGNSDAFFDRGRLRQEAGEHEAAVADYSAALRWSPPYWQPHFNRAQVLTALGRDAEALDDYARVGVLNPGHALAAARADCLRGLRAMESGDLAKAFEHFSTAIGADRALADAWANRATVHYRQGAFEAALCDIDHAIALRADADSLHNRVRILERLKPCGQPASPAL